MYEQKSLDSPLRLCSVRIRLSGYVGLWISVHKRHTSGGQATQCLPCGCFTDPGLWFSVVLDEGGRCRLSKRSKALQLFSWIFPAGCWILESNSRDYTCRHKYIHYQTQAKSQRTFKVPMITNSKTCTPNSRSIETLNCLG